MNHLARAITLGALALTMATPALAAPAGKLMRVKGSLTINGKPAKVGAVLKAGDRIVTGPATRADLALPDGSAVLLYEKSTLTLSSIGGVTRLDLGKGRALNAVHKGSDYRMRSPSAIAAVRGTVFYLSSSSPTAGYV